jgi:parvulin-like peptidyl-prolyl isomerase
LKRVVRNGAICLMALAVLPGCGNNAKKVAVRINKDTVTEDEFYKRVENVSLADLAPAAQGRGPAKAGDFAMERVIMEYLMMQMAAEKNVKPTDAEINQYIAVAKKYAQNQAMSMMPPNPFRTEDDYKQEARMALIQRGLALAPLKITPEDIKKKYEEIKGQLTEEDKYHLRVIQVSSAEKAQKALDTLKKVAFETVVLTQSEDPNSKAKSGDIGIVPQGALPPDFLSAIKDLKPNEYTKTAVKLGGRPAAAGQPAPPAQYLIAQLVEKLPGKTPTLDEAKYIAERILLNEKDPNWAQRIQGDISNSRKSADIQVNLEQYKKLVDQIKSASAPPSPAVPVPGR